MEPANLSKFVNRFNRHFPDDLQLFGDHKKIVPPLQVYLSKAIDQLDLGDLAVFGSPFGEFPRIMNVRGCALIGSGDPNLGIPFPMRGLSRNRGNY